MKKIFVNVKQNGSFHSLIHLQLFSNGYFKEIDCCEANGVITPDRKVEIYSKTIYIESIHLKALDLTYINLTEVHCALCVYSPSIAKMHNKSVINKLPFSIALRSLSWNCYRRCSVSKQSWSGSSKSYRKQSCLVRASTRMEAAWDNSSYSFTTSSKRLRRESARCSTN